MGQCKSARVRLALIYTPKSWFGLFSSNPRTSRLPHVRQGSAAPVRTAIPDPCAERYRGFFSSTRSAGIRDTESATGKPIALSASPIHARSATGVSARRAPRGFAIQKVRPETQSHSPDPQSTRGALPGFQLDALRGDSRYRKCDLRPIALSESQILRSSGRPGKRSARGLGSRRVRLGCLNSGCSIGRGA